MIGLYSVLNFEGTIMSHKNSYCYVSLRPPIISKPLMVTASVLELSVKARCEAMEWRSTYGLLGLPVVLFLSSKYNFMRNTSVPEGGDCYVSETLSFTRIRSTVLWADTRSADNKMGTSEERTRIEKLKRPLSSFVEI